MSLYISVYPPSVAAGLRFRIYLHVFFYQLSPENGSRKSSKLDIRSNKLFESHSTTFSVIPNIWFTLINQLVYTKLLFKLFQIQNCWKNILTDTFKLQILSKSWRTRIIKVQVQHAE